MRRNFLKNSIEEIDNQIARLYKIRKELKNQMYQVALIDQFPLDEEIDTVIKVVAEYFGLSVGDLFLKCRSRAIAWARQVAMVLLFELTDQNGPDIARSFSRDSSTFYYAVKTVNNRCDVDQKAKLDIDNIRELIAKYDAVEGKQELIKFNEEQI